MYALVLSFGLLLQSASIQPEKPVIQNSDRSTKAQATKKQKTQRPSQPSAGAADKPSTPQPENNSQNHTDNPDSRSYGVKILSQPEAKDTAAFLVYVGLTGIAMIVNAAILLAIIRQNKINWRQVRINAKAAKAARSSARAANLSATAAQNMIGSLDKQLTEMKTAREQTIAQMTTAGEQTNQLIEHASNQAEALLLAAEAAANQARATFHTSEATAELVKAAQKTAEIGEATAKSALLNAQALINAERAWVMVDVDFRFGTRPVKLTSGDGSISTAAEVEVSLRNSGSTPAWVFEQWVRLEVANFVVASVTEYPIPRFPPVGEGGKPKMSQVNYNILPIVKGQEPTKWRAHVSDSGWATDDNGLFVHIYGVVRYRDVSNSLRETYFGYGLWHGKLDRMPSKAYNHHT